MSESQDDVVPTREERIKLLVPAPPGYTVVMYEVATKTPERHPVVAWGVRELELWEGGSGSPGFDARVVRDTVEAMVAVRGCAEADFASDVYELDSEGAETHRILGVAAPGDETDWREAMLRDVAMSERLDRAVQEREPPIKLTTPGKPRKK